MRILLSILLFATFQVQAQKKMLGFLIKEPLIPANEIRRGGPPRDGIPSIDQPRFSPSSEYDEFPGDHRVLGIIYNGVAKAYPIGVMNWHEIVNDTFAEEPVVVTYCPLCGSGMAFKATLDDHRATFGVSGLLYNSDVLLYDRQTESLWSQIMMKAVNGLRKGEELEMIPTVNTTLSRWKERHPNTMVLTTRTGYSREYHRNPYLGYRQIEKTYFPIENWDAETLHPKALVLGVEVEGKYKAYPFKALRKARGGRIQDRLNGESITVHYDKEADAAKLESASGEELPAITLFWFAWHAFHPATEVFQP